MGAPVQHPEEDVPDDELAEEAMDPDEAADLELRALAAEEMLDINGLLAAVKRLPPDSKAGVLLEELRGLREQGYRQVMVFTQYTDTMDFLRTRIAEAFGPGVICFSGRGRRGPVHRGRLGDHLPRRDQAALPRRPRRDHGLHRRRGRGPELPVLRRPDQLRHALEPHAGRAAHRAHRPPGPGAPARSASSTCTTRTPSRPMSTTPCATASTCSRPSSAGCSPSSRACRGPSRT